MLFRMKANTTETGETIQCVDKDVFSTEMETNTKVNLTIICRMGSENTNLTMATYMKASFFGVDLMEKGIMSTKMKLSMKVIGRTD